MNWFGGWRGAIFIISALMLNLCVCGALMRPLKNKPIPTNKTAKNPTSLQKYGFVGDINYNTEHGVVLTSCNKHEDKEIIPGTQFAIKNPKYEASLESIDGTESSDSVFVDVHEDADAITFTASPEPGETCADTDNSNSDDLSTTSDFLHLDTSNNNLNAGTDASFLPSSDKIEIAKAQNELPILDMIICDDQIASDVNPKLGIIDENKQIQSMLEKLKEMTKKIVSFLAKSYGIPGVFLSPLYVMSIPAVITLAIGWYTTITYQVARAMSVGISEKDASFLLSIMGIGSLIGCIGHGWFIDRGLITNDALLAMCLAACSACTFLMTFVALYPVVALLAAIQGMTAGISNTLFIVILKTFAKPNFEECAVGMMYLIWGFGDLIGGVLGGKGNAIM